MADSTACNSIADGTESDARDAERAGVSLDADDDGKGQRSDKTRPEDLPDDADEDEDDAYEMGDEFDELCEKALSLSLMDDRTHDQLTDMLAANSSALPDAVLLVHTAIDDFERGGDPTPVELPRTFHADAAPVARSTPSTPSTPVVRARLPRQASCVAIILDTHYLAVAVKAFSLQSGWSIAAFEAALLASCGGETVTARFACDSADKPSPLHTALQTAGYELVLSPPKPSNGMQGATDVDVACCLFAAAGAFASAPVADTLCLVAGDSDFRPALSAILRARGGTLQVAVIAEAHQVGSPPALSPLLPALATRPCYPPPAPLLYLRTCHPSHCRTTIPSDVPATHPTCHPSYPSRLPPVTLALPSCLSGRPQLQELARGRGPCCARRARPDARWHGSRRDRLAG